MPFSPNNIYHVYNQGNNRQAIFLQRPDYLIFLNLYKKFFSPSASTIAWCLMPNHFHFMIYADERCDAKIKQGGICLDGLIGMNQVKKEFARLSEAFKTHFAN